VKSVPLNTMAWPGLALVTAQETKSGTPTDWYAKKHPHKNTTTNTRVYPEVLKQQYQPGSGNNVML